MCDSASTISLLPHPQFLPSRNGSKKPYFSRFPRSPARNLIRIVNRARVKEDEDRGFDVLELKREAEEMDKEKKVVASPDEDRQLEPRKGKQMVRRSSLFAKQVVSIRSARNLGFVSQLWVDSISWTVVVVEVRPHMLSGEIERLLLEDLYQVGDVVLVRDESVMENDLKLNGLDSLVGYNVVTPARRKIGKVRGFNFDINSGLVESLELDSLGMSLIPASLVSTYSLMVEDVVQVIADAVVVDPDAESRLQRLTKGLLDKGNAEVRGLWDDNEEFPEFTNRAGRSTRRQRSRPEDYWDLPVDF